MRTAYVAPPIAPNFDVTVHIVLDDFGATGRAYRETDETRATLGEVVDNLLTGQYSDPVRVVAFNTSEGWARDVSEDVAWEVLRRSHAEGKMVPDTSRGFIEFHVGSDEMLRAENGLL